MDIFLATGHTSPTKFTGRARFTVYLRFEKFSHRDGQHRYLVLSLAPTLFGDWCVVQASGPIGKAGGHERRNYCASLDEAEALFNSTRQRQVKRGFVPIPVQMGLF
ncbi:WGR domain-containing protein [Tritonibacter horizontis]|uniref:WGR domain-containing protein n=1 Tax=Tritonibacter horizontis TaxID=1768241 RepID=A0A132BZB5_9RHOB|nr:WGR domain-containing protein [Tritonibacter horizontis]KUP93713.1 hypothetical protein TRIHO_14150 [Tritonibacter horizontis]